MKQLTEAVAQLDEAMQSKFDTFLKKNEIAKKGSRAGAEAKDLKAEIVAAMGEATIAELPDGRRIQKVHKTGHKRPQPACDYEWWELAELPAAA